MSTEGGVCREARDGACMMYREMGAQKRRPVDGGRHGAHDSMQRAERMRAVQCTTGNDGDSTKCKNTMCDVWINRVQYCSQCAKADEFLLNGECKTAESSSGCVLKSPNDGTCQSCGANYLLYKGGCYSKDAAPGSTMCTAASAGVCSAAASGYFIPPGATRTDQSIMACDDTAEITLTNTKKYAGAANCGTCGAPAAASEANAKATTCTA